MILITGATGFLGRHLVRELSKQGYKLRCLARKTSNIEHLKHPNIKIYYGDITSSSSIKNALKGVNIVIHLVAVYGVSNRSKYYNVNVEGTKNLIEACKEGNVKRIIFLGSIAAIREHKGLYGQTKLEAESLFKNSGLDVTILRPELIYGEGGKEFEKIITFLKKFPIIPIVGSGNYKRRFVYVEDVVSSIIATIENKETIGKTYNIVSSEEISFNDILDIISSRMNIKKLKIKIPVPLCLLVAKILSLLPNPPLTVDEIYGVNQDISFNNKEAIKDLKFNPIPFREGIKKLNLL